MENLVRTNNQTVMDFRALLHDLLKEAHPEFLAGPAYASWYDNERNIIRTGLGPLQA
jgi:hypothetical protein